MKKKSLFTKALFNTLIFSLILINLVLWPYLFSLIKGESASAPVEDERETEMMTDERDKTKMDSLVETEEVESADVEEENMTNIQTSQGEKMKIFKIIRID